VGHLGDPTFAAYLQNELEISPRSGYYMVQVHEAGVTYNLSFESMRAVGYTKMATLLPVLDTENVREWMEKANGCSVRELQTKIKEAKQSEDYLQSMSVRVSDSQSHVINQALEQIELRHGVESKGQGLEYLAAEYLAGGQHVDDEAVTGFSVPMEQSEAITIMDCLVTIGRSENCGIATALLRACQSYCRQYEGK